MQALSECIACLQSCVMGFNMYLEYVACCSATWPKICLQPLHSLLASSISVVQESLYENIVRSSADWAVFHYIYIFCIEAEGTKCQTYVDIVAKPCFFEMVSITIVCCR